MRIINASYEVLSDPARRAEHDRWIASVEVDPHQGKSPPIQWPTAKPRSPDTVEREPVPPPIPLRAEGEFVKRLTSIGILVVVVVMGGAIISSIGTSPIQTATPLPKTLTIQDLQTTPDRQPKTYTLVPRNAATQTRYSRPALAPNGRPWPSSSGYVFEQSEEGNSVVTVDNVQNSSDMLVKLFDRRFKRPAAVRVSSCERMSSSRCRTLRLAITISVIRTLTLALYPNRSHLNLKRTKKTSSCQIGCDTESRAQTFS